MRRGIKSGWRSSEFWVTVLPIIGTWAMAMEDIVPPKYAALATAIATSAYTIARGLAKTCRRRVVKSKLSPRPRGEA